MSEDYDEKLASIQPKTYWEKRCFATEQFVEMFVSVVVNNMTKSDRELAKHLIAKYQESIASIPPPIRPVVGSVKKALYDKEGKLI